MTDNKRWCVLIPCSATETWAVPQNCLAEIVTVHTDSEEPPHELMWRGQTVPVLDLGGHDGSLWLQPHRDAGLLAVFLGLKGEGCEYWAVAVRGEDLRVAAVTPETVEDVADAVQAHATAAFRFNGVLCQVPDLDSLQKKVAVDRRVA